MQFFKGLFGGLGIGIGVTLALYALAFLVEFLNCLTCGILTCQCFGPESGIRACNDPIWTNGCAGICGVEPDIGGIFPMWSGKIFLNILIFCGIAGTAIGIIYGIATSDEPGTVLAAIFFPITGPIYGIYRLATMSKDLREGRKDTIYSASKMVRDVKNKSDNIVSLIQNAEKSIVSTKAKKLLEEASVEANKSVLAMNETVTLNEKASGKSSKSASRNAIHAEDTSRWSEKYVDAANDLYKKAKNEEDDWNRLQQEVKDSVNNANNAADKAEKEVAKIEKIAFVSAAAKDAAEKAVYALTKAKEAAAETVKRADAAANSTSAYDAQSEVLQAKYSEKRTLVEEKIAIEEANIAMEAER